MTEKFLSTNQVAHKLGINVRSVPRLTRINYIRIGLATILFIVCIGALAYAFQGKPMMYLLFVTICGIGLFIVMATTWSD